MMTTSKRIKKAKEGKLLLLLLIHSTREKRKNNENTNKTKQIREREREREEEEVADVHTNNTNIHESVVISFGLEIRRQKQPVRDERNSNARESSTHTNLRKSLNWKNLVLMAILAALAAQG